MWVVKTFDFSWADWLFALFSSVVPRDRSALARRVEETWSPAGDALACFSVRSAFDLLLRAAEWGDGDEIVFTALTVPDMTRIARHHGLRVVPLDIDPVTTAPDPGAFESLLSDRTRAIVFTHLFGARLDVRPFIAIARQNGVLFIEDCAQAYIGPAWTGHSESDVTLFSFGPMKTATALGGALAIVRDVDLLSAMRALNRRAPIQSSLTYAVHAKKYGALKILTVPAVFGALVRLLDLLGHDHRQLAHRLTKSFFGPSFFRRIRQRPSTALLSLMERRIGQGEAPSRRRIAPGRALVEALDGEIVTPSSGSAPHAFWMFPVRVPDREALMDALHREGFDSTVGRLSHVTDDRDPATDPVGARELNDSSLYLPFYPELPESEIRRLAEATLSAVNRPLRP